MCSSFCRANRKQHLEAHLVLLVLTVLLVGGLIQQIVHVRHVVQLQHLVSSTVFTCINFQLATITHLELDKPASGHGLVVHEVRFVSQILHRSTRWLQIAYQSANTAAKVPRSQP